MSFNNKVAIITGGGGGIGSALATALAREGAKVVVSDLQASAVEAVVEDINDRYPDATVAVVADAADTADITRLVEQAESTFGPVDMFFANAGVAGEPGLHAAEESWDTAFEVNVRAHVRAAQVMIPRWLDRGEGYFISTASAAGLLTQIGMPSYSVTKHAALGFAEWLSVTYGDQGIRVSCLCPMAVETPLLHAGEQIGDEVGAMATRAVTSAGDILEPSVVADVVLEALKEERFLILPHPEVLEMHRRKGADYDRWLRGMRRYQNTLAKAGQSTVS